MIRKYTPYFLILVSFVILYSAFYSLEKASRANTVVATITVGDRPSGIAYNPDNHNMYVTNGDPNTVSVIDSSNNRVIDNITVGNAPTGIAYNPDNKHMYVTNGEDNTVSVIDTTSNTVIG